MKLRRITALYFSPTGGTRRAARFVAEDLAQRLSLETRFIDLTGPEARKEDRRFCAQELVLAAVPVYAGRIPNKLLPDLERGLAGGGAPAYSWTELAIGRPYPSAYLGTAARAGRCGSWAAFWSAEDSARLGPPRLSAATPFRTWWGRGGRTRPTGPRCGSFPPGRRPG